LNKGGTKYLKKLLDLDKRGIRLTIDLPFEKTHEELIKKYKLTPLEKNENKIKFSKKSEKISLNFI